MQCAVSLCDAANKGQATGGVTTMRIGLLRHQQPFAEFDPINNRWRIWYIYNNDVTSGTYYDLYNDGTCDRVTVADRDVVSISRVADAVVSPTGPVTDQLLFDLEAKALWQDGYEM